MSAPLDQPWHVLVPGVLGPAERDALLGVAEAIGWTWIDEGDAPRVGPAGYQSQGGRRQHRAALDDPPLAQALWAALRARLPELPREDTPVDINPRLRFYATVAGGGYPAHTDGAWIVDGRTRSRLTLLVYLTDDFEGGQTWFMDDTRRIQPEAGAALVFPHGRWHAGGPVIRGRKVVLRTDLLCEPLP